MINGADTPEQVVEILREVLQVLLVQDNLDDFLELYTKWTVRASPCDPCVLRHIIIVTHSRCVVTPVCHATLPRHCACLDQALVPAVVPSG